MSASTISRDRLEELLTLAQAYRGWTRKRLAEALGRDPSKLVPQSGVPKLDVIVDLAQALDWPVEQIISLIDRSLPLISTAISADSSSDFEVLDQAACEAHGAGRYMEMVELARKAFVVAESDDERSRAANREAGGWDGLGLYRNALGALRRGLAQTDATPDRQLLLQSNLANAHYTLWNLYEGRGVASDVISWFRVNPPTTQAGRVAFATAHYARGNCYRRMLETTHTDDGDIARLARSDLARASGIYSDLAASMNRISYAETAGTCRGGMMEAEVVMGVRDVDNAIGEYLLSLDAPSAAIADCPVGDGLERLGWWCIFGCNVVLRHMKATEEQERLLAVFTNKANEVAERLDNWSMRERVVTMDFVRRQRVREATNDPGELIIDSEDVRLIAGTMGRFPEFRGIGWKILRSSHVVRE